VAGDALDPSFAAPAGAPKAAPKSTLSASVGEIRPPEVPRGRLRRFAFPAAAFLIGLVGLLVFSMVSQRDAEQAEEGQRVVAAAPVALHDAAAAVATAAPPPDAAGAPDRGALAGKRQRRVEIKRRSRGTVGEDEQKRIARRAVERRGAGAVDPSKREYPRKPNKPLSGRSIGEGEPRSELSRTAEVAPAPDSEGEKRQGDSPHEKTGMLSVSILCKGTGRRELYIDDVRYDTEPPFGRHPFKPGRYHLLAAIPSSQGATPWRAGPRDVVRSSRRSG
jgi:hypothetical protein